MTELDIKTTLEVYRYYCYCEDIETEKVKKKKWVSVESLLNNMDDHDRSWANDGIKWRQFRKQLLTIYKLKRDCK
jgi:hypothetical protein